MIAPAGEVDVAALHQGMASLQQLGFRVIVGKNVEKRYRYFAGADQERADDLLEMMRNPDVDAIICARGGSGSGRIIPYLTRINDPFPPKIFVGYSDITTLLLYLSRHFGFVTFHGPMVATDFPTENLLRVLSGEMMTMRAPGVVALKDGTADGILTGGCLSILCTTIGTSYEIDTDGTVLFIEDIAEPPYRIDRMLSYLKGLGKFDRIRGLIVGQMPGCNKEALPEIILEIFSDFEIPILFDFPSGHGESLFTLPFGLPVCVNTMSRTVTMLAPAVI